MQSTSGSNSSLDAVYEDGHGDTGTGDRNSTNDFNQFYSNIDMRIPIRETAILKGIKISLKQEKYFCLKLM